MTHEPGHHVPGYPVASVSRTLGALEVLAAAESVSVAELREALGIGASTAHRLLAMLVFHGYARHLDDRRYAQGPALSALARGTVLGRETPEPVQEAMAAVATRCGETVHVGSLIGTDILYTDAIDSPAVLRVTTRVGIRQPAHGTSMGRSMLAELDPDDLDAMYPGTGPPALPSGVHYSRTELDAMLAAIRARGWAENHGDVEDGVSSVAVAVHGSAGRLGLSISGPSTRMPAERVADLAQVLVEECAALDGTLSG